MQSVTTCPFITLPYICMGSDEGILQFLVCQHCHLFQSYDDSDLEHKLYFTLILHCQDSREIFQKIQISMGRPIEPNVMVDFK